MFLRLLATIVVVVGVAASASAGLVSYFPMNEPASQNPSSGTTIADVVNSAGTCLLWADGPGPVCGVASYDPYFGTALHFSATDGAYGDQASPRAGTASGAAWQALVSDFTVAAWVKPDASEPTKSQQIMGSPIAGDKGWGFEIIGDKLGLRTTNSGGGFKADYVGPNSAITPGVWTHVAATLDAAGNLKLYRGGLLTDTLTGVTTGAGSTGNWFMGFNGETPYATYTGAMDEVRGYNTVLSQPEIAALMDVPEPSTLMLLTAGVFGLLAYAWRKRK